MTFYNCSKILIRYKALRLFIKVWLSYAQFEANNPKNGDNIHNTVRDIYKKAYSELKNSATNESRVMILEAWKEYEIMNDQDDTYVEYVQNLMPKQIRKRRKIIADDGVSLIILFFFNFFNTHLKLFKTDAGWEEYIDYVFPDDESAQPSLKLLALAKKWKENMTNSAAGQT